MPKTTTIKGACSHEAHRHHMGRDPRGAWCCGGSAAGGLVRVGVVSAFTPGPWTVEHYGDGDSLVLHSDGNTRVCFMATPGSSPRVFPTIEANARLIAAAPDLYEALTAMEAEKADYMRLNNLGDPAKEHTNKMARAAIAKADGQ